MYNLFVSADSKEWAGDPSVLELGRCVREYTDSALSARFGELDLTSISELRRFPCIFAYEVACQKDPHFGVIRDVTRHVAKVE